ncbi:kinase-like domain-containing protein [Armillaria borealis]|uniref:non-specific serine/threonine protein kinase n=1 Tax=Armillaria borealis TaxID=47425 RepID=A0AA39MLM5_9AGAR|nr:kinase-like domain-containing protein [Armillaria borealis]
MSIVKYPKVAGYELVQQIGGGGFSTVFRAVHFEEHRVAACKVISLTDATTEKERKTIDKEMRVHAALKHTNVLEFYNAVVVEVKHKHLYHPGIYMLLELAAGGDLFDKIAPDVGVGDEVAHLYFNQLVTGMDYIHSQGVCHRDLKPENLLLDVAGTLKISDFGLSAVYKLKDSGKIRTLTERCGSLPYVAPELASDAPYKAEPIDVWGMGVILFTLLAGNTPWDEPTMNSTEFVRYVNGEIFDDPLWCHIRGDALSLLTGLLCIDPEERLSISQIYQHPWCMRPSQLAQRGALALADKLTETLRKNGDLGLAAPNFAQPEEEVDADGDQMMFSAGHSSQFTQSLMLFSQTQSGNRYTPHLTRFYASLGPSLLLTLIQESLEELGVRCKPSPDSSDGVHRLRIGGRDRRKEIFKGWVLVERFTYRGSEGSFCIMQRDEGNPISWRQLWKALIMSPSLEPHVLRK